MNPTGQPLTPVPGVRWLWAWYTVHRLRVTSALVHAGRARLPGPPLLRPALAVRLARTGDSEERRLGVDCVSILTGTAAISTAGTGWA